MTNEYNPDGKEIRFIDSHYKDLFHIPDGSCVQIHYPDEMVVKPCTFIDEYHTQIGYNVFHICQFAEIMERNGASYMPEPEIMGDEAAWKVGKDRILAVQTCEDGYDYTLLDENYNEIDGGQVDNPELSMLEVRRDILESFGLERRELRAMFYEDVMEQAFEVGRQAVVVNDPIAELAFKLDRFAENFDPYEYMDQVDDVQAHIQEINPFAYIHSEKDILKLVTTLIANTKGEGKAGDDFWVKAETLLYTALIGYIHYEAPVEEQNFSTLIEFINAMEVREDDEDFKNPVDLMFEELKKRKPDHFAVRQYAKFKLSAGKTAKSIRHVHPRQS